MGGGILGTRRGPDRPPAGARHQGNHAQGTVPLLAIDAWEHAFYLQYENRKAEFFEALWNIVNWSDVQARFDQARQPHLDAPRPEAQP